MLALAGSGGKFSKRWIRDGLCACRNTAAFHRGETDGDLVKALSARGREPN